MLWLFLTFRQRQSKVTAYKQCAIINNDVIMFEIYRASSGLVWSMGCDSLGKCNIKYDQIFNKSGTVVRQSLKPPQTSPIENFF